MKQEGKVKGSCDSSDEVDKLVMRLYVDFGNFLGSSKLQLVPSELSSFYLFKNEKQV